VLKQIEAVRSAGGVGSSLQAEVEIHAAGETYDLLAALGDDLKFVLICSKATLVKLGAGETAVQVIPSPHKKCVRCWHWRDDVGHDAAHPELCCRCTSNLHGAGEAREFA
jgi:isoleucyl-tRNA synthetase